jgi:hypothetical protein
VVCKTALSESLKLQIVWGYGWSNAASATRIIGHIVSEVMLRYDTIFCKYVQLQGTEYVFSARQCNSSHFKEYSVLILYYLHHAFYCKPDNTD